jgi:hypothetical protein
VLTAQGDAPTGALRRVRVGEAEHQAGDKPADRVADSAQASPRHTPTIDWPPRVSPANRRPDFQASRTARQGPRGFAESPSAARGGLTTKALLAVDGKGRPIAVLLTGGQVNDSPLFPVVLDAIAVARVGAAMNLQAAVCSR